MRGATNFELRYMKNLILIAVCIFLMAGLYAQDSEGFVSIFNGEDLAGWTSSEDKPESFLVEDGTLVCRGGKAHIYYTGGVNRSDFKNFELKLKVKTMAEANSGVYFHTTYQKDGWPKIGFEAQVNSRHADPRKTGSLYGIVNMWVTPDDEEYAISSVSEKPEVFIARDAAPSTDGEWFDYHITVVDKTITIKVDGVTTVQWTQPEFWLSDRRVGHGTFAFQAHDPTCEVFYKDIRVKVLD